MYTFQNRDTELELVQAATGEGSLLNFHGEGGIGKTRLLKEAEARITDKVPGSLVIYVNLQKLDPTKGDCFDDVVAELSAGLSDNKDDKQNKEQNSRAKSSEIVARLLQQSEQHPVFLFFDGTEVFQKDADFWERMEQKIVSPILLEGRIHQVFAGRVPAPWRRFEVRRVVKSHRLKPLDKERDAAKLVQEVFTSKRTMSAADKRNWSEASDLVLSFSFGHAGLTEKLAEYAAEYWDATNKPDFESQMCAQVIKPFVDDFFFKDVQEPWKKILWWISPLEWFDATVLKLYLGRVAPEIVDGESEFFFIKGISELRIQHRVLWSEDRGDHLQGVIREIMNKCMQVSEPQRYITALEGAASTMEEFIEAFPEGAEERKTYESDKKFYQSHLARYKTEIKEG